MLIFLIGSKMDEEDLQDLLKDLPPHYTFRIFTTGMVNYRPPGADCLQDLELQINIKLLNEIPILW